MPDIALITSLYRSEPHLPLFIERVRQIATQLELALQLVVVVNDATQIERDLLDELLAVERVAVKIIHCERETLYASWNRGIAQADSGILGFWNVDDNRTAEGLAEGYRLLKNGTDLVDFAYNIQNMTETTVHPPAYQADNVHPKTGLAPFFMMHRRLYARAGKFNENFRITGDFEFSKRPIVREADSVRSDIVAGTFILHGDNLSGGTNPREWVEFNIALMLHGYYQFIRPVDPEIFRAVYADWGDAIPDIPAETLNWLIGADAEERFNKYERQRHATIWQRRLHNLLVQVGLRANFEQLFEPPTIT